MAPKKAYGPATRRSSRLASQTTSRASSVSQETTSAPAQTGKFRPRKRAAEPVHDFDASVAHSRIVQEGDRHYIQRLTDSEKGAVIHVLADREVDLLDRIRELEAENADLSMERDEALVKVDEKLRLRDLFFRERLQQAVEQREEEARAAAASADTTTVVSEQQEEAEEEREAEPTNSPSGLTTDSSLHGVEYESTPVASVEVVDVVAPAPAQLDVVATPMRHSSLLRRVFNTITSPFARRPTVEIVDTQTGSSPLGELPASRKRPAPDPTPEVSPSPLPSLPEKQRQHPAGPPSTPGPSSRNPAYPTSLSTITEHTEPSFKMPESTPTRPTAEPRTPHTYRSIASVRSAQRQKAANTPIHSWTQPPRPRDPNADRRLEKLRRYQHVSQELEALKRDEDLRDVVGHRVKRVKVDDLAHIPHNKPGDAKGTFRVPDIDSDDEMEVDDSSEMRTNIFARAAEEKKEEKNKQKPISAEPASPRSQSDDSVHTVRDWPEEGNALPTKIVDSEDDEVYDWPNAGAHDPSSELSEPSSKKAYNVFKQGLDHWSATGEVVPLILTGLD